MIQSEWSILAIELISVPIFIYAVSIAARRWGPSVGGWIVSLPVSSGPVLFFLALEQGYSFASRAAQGTMMGLISVSMSCFVYSKLSFKVSWQVSLAVSWVTFFVVGLLLDFLSTPLVWSFVIVVGFSSMIWIVSPSGELSCARPKTLAWEIPARMLVATTLVLIITASASGLGPQLSGLLTPFPIYATVLAVFIHKFDGAAQCALFLRGVIFGFFTTAIFFFTIASIIVQVGLLPAFGLAMLAAIISHSVLFYVLRRFEWER